MGSMRIPVLVLIACLGCQSEAQTPPPIPVKKGVDVEKIPEPEHSAKEMTEPPPEPLRSPTKGRLDATVAGKVVHLDYMSPATNAAVYAEDAGVAFVKIRGKQDAVSPEGLTIHLEHLRLDTAKLPATFTTNGEPKNKVELKVKYEIGPAKWWSAETGKHSDNAVEVILEKFEGSTLTGTFKGKLEPRTPDMGDPLEIKGQFAVELRLNGVEEGKVG
jgi:hypothetical protein